MKNMLTLIVAVFLFAVAQAGDSTYLQKIEAKARAEHKFILLNFSGSDWCVPCIKMKKTIFAADTFRQFAARELVWINADFPRSKKILSKEEVNQNEQLAEQFNTTGSFPFTLLLDDNGNVLKTWDGNPNVSAEAFIEQLAATINDKKQGNKHAAQKGAPADGQSL